MHLPLQINACLTRVLPPAMQDLFIFFTRLCIRRMPNASEWCEWFAAMKIKTKKVSNI